MLCAALLFLQGCTTTMTRSDCSNPRVSNLIAPNAYLVVLPYRYRGSDSSRHDDAERINRVIALQAIRIAADMERTHITLVEGDPDDPQCGIESVYERVVDNRTGLFWRRVFHSAVFLWGEIYDAPDGLTLQTHLRTYWNGPRERTLAVELGPPVVTSPLRFTGELPDSTVSFPLHTLPMQVQRGALQAAQDDLEVREWPETLAPAAPLPKKFIVGRWRKPWLELIDRTGPAVWLRVPDQFGAAATLLPELSFARALTAYLTHRVDGRARSREAVRSALHDFRSQLAAKTDPLMRGPLALAAAMEGTLSLVGEPAAATATATPPAAGGAGDAAPDALAGAAAQSPARADLLNLAALARIAGCCQVDTARTVDVILRDLERAYRLDPADGRITMNLLQWYELLLALPQAQRPLQTDEIERRRSALRQSLRGTPAL